MLAGSGALLNVFQQSSGMLETPLLCRQMLQSLNLLHRPTLDSLQYVHVFLVLRSPERDTVLQVWFHPC